MLFREIKVTDSESDNLDVQLVTSPLLEHHKPLGMELRMPCMHVDRCVCGMIMYISAKVVHLLSCVEICVVQPKHVAGFHLSFSLELQPD